jgi:small-conductance mechanosensitive channel
MLDFSKITNWGYLTTKNPGADFEFLPHLLIFFGFLAFLAIVISLTYRPTNHLYRHFKSQILKMFWTCSALGFVLIFFRWQSLGIFQQRVWLLGLLILFLFWLLYLFIFRYLIFPKRLDFYRKQLEFKKYLPLEKETSNNK